MIVTKNLEGWNIFFHMTHALLAFKIGMNIKEKWNKRDNLTQAGAPKDYRQPSPMAFNEVKLLMSSCLHKSAFMSLMVSIHCRSIYKDKKGKKIGKFISDQEALCDSIIKHLEITSDQAEASYQILRFCDELSLMLCQDDVPKESRKIQLEPIPGIDENFIRKDVNGYLRLDHWCFNPSEFTLFSEYYQTKKLSYNSDNELISELTLGKPNFINFEFKLG